MRGPCGASFPARKFLRPIQGPRRRTRSSGRSRSCARSILLMVSLWPEDACKSEWPGTRLVSSDFGLEGNVIREMTWTTYARRYLPVANFASHSHGIWHDWDFADNLDYDFSDRDVVVITTARAHWLTYITHAIPVEHFRSLFTISICF